MRFIWICWALMLGWGASGCSDLPVATSADGWAYGLMQRDCVDNARDADEARVCRIDAWRKCQATYLGGCPAGIPR